MLKEADRQIEIEMEERERIKVNTAQNMPSIEQISALVLEEEDLKDAHKIEEFAR